LLKQIFQGLLQMIGDMMQQRWWLALAIAAILAGPATAQFSDSFNFLKAVRDRDGAKVTEMVDAPTGRVLINTKDGASGDSALHIVTRGRDETWLRFMLAKGAKTDLRNNAGETPLGIAARIGFAEGVQALLAGNANVNFPNARGETALILAVQQRDMPTTRLLLAAGADPKLSDRAAGMNARDYAARDPRAATLLKLIDQHLAAGGKQPAAVAGPKL
jgi:uncharacterized protein